MSHISELDIDLQNMTQWSVDKQVSSVFTKAAIHDVTVRVLHDWVGPHGWYFYEDHDYWWVQTRAGGNGLYFTTFGEMLEFLLMDMEQTR